MSSPDCLVTMMTDLVKDYSMKICTLLTVVHCTDSQHPQVLDLLVLGLHDEELHALGQVLDILGQGLLDEELHALGLAKFSTCLYRGYMMESCTPLVRLFRIR